MNRIRKQFSIEWYGQKQVPYGPKHGLYKKKHMSNIVLSWNIMLNMTDTSTLKKKKEGSW